MLDGNFLVPLDNILNEINRFLFNDYYTDADCTNSK